MGDGTVISLSWRDSRGWQVSMWQGTEGKQICQLKPNSYAFNGKGSASDAALELMIVVAESYVAGTTEFEHLIKFRNSLLGTYGFEQIGALKRPAAAPRLASAGSKSSGDGAAVVPKTSTAMPSIAKRPSGDDGHTAAPHPHVVAAQPPPITMRSLGATEFNDGFLSNSEASDSD